MANGNYLTEKSKHIATNDDASKDFIKYSLADTPTRGFDVDSVYCEVADGKIQWIIIEYLKCVTFPPENSHPANYWNKGKNPNRRKFLALWALCRSLCQGNGGHTAKMMLVNYSDAVYTDPQSKVRVMWVKNATEEAIETEGEEVIPFTEWQKRFQAYNTNKPGSTWEALALLTSTAPTQASSAAWNATKVAT